MNYSEPANNKMSIQSNTRRISRCFGLNQWMSRSSKSISRISPHLFNAILAATQRLDFSLSPSKTIAKLKAHRWSLKGDAQYLIMITVSGLSLWFCGLHWLIKISLIILYTSALLVPLTSQFFLPASPIFTWVILFFSNRYIPMSFRSKIHIWVSILPTLESVLYGANISDILTRYTHPLLDILAWLPYGVLHFVLPFVVAIFLFVFGGPGAVKFYGKALGYMNLSGVVIQIFFPCAPPWYELSHGLTPANYDMPGEAGGLARIDAIFHSQGYTTTFRNSPIVFGAFPSLHAGFATLEALFLSHYFPRWRVFYWTYAFILYWSTMYLTHHYLVDLVAGGALAVASFYLFLTEDQRHLPMLNASIAGEEDSIAKGYHSGIRGMLGHRGANGTWSRIRHSNEPEDPAEDFEFDHLFLDDQLRLRDEEERLGDRPTGTRKTSLDTLK
ncbi:Aureobasidin resistance protein Aur1 [Puccinia graminis f. sp. tritici]|uniref:Phosphatidic acid phosphatase type 2/haloperoxidase domain-containing protein n=3 Tax=Puccinia graminis f. sp. tritici TaxID=56615 RepID=E3KXB0_PUCGT|nr:uncharacterized protein PGTG_15186 [Puccinia graminis f. sp. tritici CRL 75-36-700-3]EFP88983.2 hypothetical protein PGTG_15186 [Puccinia graminis f. sp. tritici CRL 75-36-700-3]KAA1097719.1 Aureobasidin resistance protein Aur1 [Puccinia graminis f. sp. tritici]KAA1101335.1 Aureobasidin resistance protein Aur1 [Puccinia graminis f. sp. tritici]KAA1126059.1 Aureobasidin resistance protein Aur1 [Puccinia graminis f. sp. tritici]